MDIVVVGVNHKRAPVEVREKIAVPEEAVPETLRALPAPEAVILSTCNRVEVYAASEEALDDATIARTLARQQDVDLYRRRGLDAVRHLFRVAAGLDAMVVGETQILAQVKEAYRAAQEAGRTGRILNFLFQRALYVAKRVHTETAIGEKNVSVSSVAAQLAGKIFQDLAEKTVLILGAGETGELTLRAFHDRGVRRILVANRTPENAQKLVREFRGEAHDLSSLATLLPRADIVISCVAADAPVLDRETVAAALRARRNEPVFLIDIAVPRNVSPDAGTIGNVYLFNVDDLESIVNQNLLERGKELRRCEPIIETEASDFMNEIAGVDVVAVLKDLRERVQAVGNEELQRTLSKLEGIPPEKKKEVEELVHRLVSKILHAPTTALREEAMNGRRHGLVELVRRLFGLK